MFLERIREEYEQHRQPETLSEASEYMSQLTGGKYTRIWTPLAHDILFVDTADGQPLPVQVLSRGTREQLFVSLRLALVAAYARRGIHLPMILDDVFVNFDAGRTQDRVRRASRFRQARPSAARVHLPRARVADVPGDQSRHAANSESPRRSRRGTVVEQPVPEPIVVELPPEPVVVAPKLIEQILAEPNLHHRLSSKMKSTKGVVEKYGRAGTATRTRPRSRGSGILVARTRRERRQSFERCAILCAKRMAPRAGHLSGKMVARISAAD